MVLSVLLLASVRIVQSTEAEIAASELRSFLESLRGMVRDLGGKSSDSKVDASATVLTIFREAKDEAYRLREEIAKVKKSKLIDMREVDTIRSECKRKIYKIQREMSELRKNASLEERNYQDNCTLDYQEFKDESFTNCSQLERQHNEVCHKLVVDHLALNDYEQAYLVYKELNDDAELSEFVKIVSEAYNPKSMTVEIIIKFINLLENCRLKKTARSILFQVMIIVGSINMDFLHLEAMQGCVYEDVLGIYVHQVREALAAGMMNGVCADISTFVHKSRVSASLGMEEVRRMITEEEDVFKGEEKRIINLVKCFKELKDPWLILTGYTAILEKIEQKNFLFWRMTIYLAHQVDNLIKGESPPLQAFDVKDRFPMVIKDIIWRKYCSFKSVDYQEWLYLADITTASPEEGIVRRLLTENNKEKMNGTEWLLKPVKDGLQFQLINTRNIEGNFMCVGPWKKSKGVYESVGGYAGEFADWEIHLQRNVNASVDYVWLRNVKVGGYLYATSWYFDDDSRHVFVKTASDKIPAAAWEMECVDKIQE